MTFLKASKLYRVIYFILLLVSFTTKAQSPQLSTSIDKHNIIIGEPLQYRVEAIFPANAFKVSWLNIPDSFAHFEVIERQKADTVEANGTVKIRQVITLTSFDSGTRVIPSFPLRFFPFAGDSAFDLFTDSLKVNVSFSPMDSTKTFHDIKTIIQVKDEWPLWLWIAAGLSLALLILLIRYLVKRLRKKKPEDVFTSKLSPFDEALQSLAELKKQQLLNSEQVKQFHSRLGEIFKRYVSRKTNSNLLTLTSGEILLKLTELNIHKENVALMAGNLRMADAVKFAKYLPGNSDSEDAWSGTKKVIEQIDQTITKSKSGI